MGGLSGYFAMAISVALVGVASWVVIGKLGLTGPMEIIARSLIMGAAFSYRNYVQHPHVTVPLEAFSITHSPPARRFYNLLCMAHGADSQLFADFVEDGHLPRDRGTGCRREFGEVAWAIQTLIVPHVDQQLAKQVLNDRDEPAEK
jgi:hypothetical protein